MPYLRTEYLREAVDWTRGGTYREDLPKSGLLTGLLFEVSGSCVSGATAATADTWLADFLEKVEILGNGAEVIASLDWEHIAYLTYLAQSKMPPTFWRNYATATQFEQQMMLFGRSLGDTQFGLDLSRWKNVEIRMTNDTSSTYHSAALSLDVKLIFIEELAGAFPGGYIRAEEFRSWTTVQNATEYLDLPDAFPMRGIHLQLIPDIDGNYLAETNAHNNADDIELAVRARAHRIFKGGADHLFHHNHFEFPGTPITSFQADKTADYGFNVGLGRPYGIATSSLSKDGAVSANIPTMEDRNDYTQKLEDREADSPVGGLVLGLAPFNFGTLFYERECRPDWLLNPNTHGPITLDVHTRDAASAPDGTNTVVLESVVAHPA
ncbi:MAG: hypothetical protein GY767_13995 [Shimia sp.]|nr:hypothetical protein [Shimia sp.]